MCARKTTIRPGIASSRQFNNAMHLGKLGRKLVLKRREAFDRIRSLGFEAAEHDEWYGKKMPRDRSARRECFSAERNERYVNSYMKSPPEAHQPSLPIGLPIRFSPSYFHL